MPRATKATQAAQEIEKMLTEATDMLRHHQMVCQATENRITDLKRIRDKLLEKPTPKTKKTPTRTAPRAVEPAQASVGITADGQLVG